jgi:hypothetical protein
MATRRVKIPNKCSTLAAPFILPTSHSLFSFNGE